MKIIIVQSDSDHYFFCSRAINQNFPTSRKMFCLCRNDDNVRQHIISGERQLFITGSYYGFTKHIPQLVNELRGINAELVCMSYSVDPLPEVFDHVIEKEGGDYTDKLIEAICGFLDGKLNRKPELASKTPM